MRLPLKLQYCVFVALTEKRAAGGYLYRVTNPSLGDTSIAGVELMYETQPFNTSHPILDYTTEQVVARCA